MTKETLPDHYVRLIDIAREAGGYSATKGTNGQEWCDEMVGKGLLTKRGVYVLDALRQHTQWAKTHQDELCVYDTTVSGRELIGKPYTTDPTYPKSEPHLRPEYNADETYGRF